MVTSGHSLESSARGKNLVGFAVGGVTYAADILRVREILNPLDVVPLPNTPPAVVGVVEHRGEVIPVVDLRIRFGVAEISDRQGKKWVVVTAFGRHVALAVDSVTEVFGIRPEQGWNATMPDLGETTQGIRSVYRKGDSLVFVLDIDAVVEPTRELNLHAALPGAGKLA